MFTQRCKFNASIRVVYSQVLELDIFQEADMRTYDWWNYHIWPLLSGQWTVWFRMLMDFQEFAMSISEFYVLMQFKKWDSSRIFKKKIIKKTIKLFIILKTPYFIHSKPLAKCFSGNFDCINIFTNEHFMVWIRIHLIHLVWMNLKVRTLNWKFANTISRTSTIMLI